MSLNEQEKTAMTEELYKVITRLNTPQDAEMLFADLLTNKEIEQMAQRVLAAKLLLEGHTYTQIIGKTDISSATLSRVSRCVLYGSGGYKKFIEYKGKED